MKIGPDMDDEGVGPAIREDARRTADTITAMVGMLAQADDLGGEPIRELMGQVYCLIGSGTTPATVTPMVQTPSALCIGSATDVDSQQMVIMFPVGWSSMAESDPWMAMGALVYCGSQCVDWFNERLVGQMEEAGRRAQAYEATYLHALGSRLKPNAYQREVMSKFPGGISDVSELLYECREVPAPLPRGSSREPM